jgi:hypothetical protein
VLAAVAEMSEMLKGREAHGSEREPQRYGGTGAAHDRDGPTDAPVTGTGSKGPRSGGKRPRQLTGEVGSAFEGKIPGSAFFKKLLFDRKYSVCVVSQGAPRKKKLDNGRGWYWSR